MNDLHYARRNHRDFIKAMKIQKTEKKKYKNFMHSKYDKMNMQ